MVATIPSLPELMFFGERAGQFALGHVFQWHGGVLDGGNGLASGAIGRWRCDVSAGNRLTWCARVYELFSLPVGNDVARSEAVACYGTGSQVVLERVRAFALRNKCGFILDASMGNGLRAPRLRVLAVPELQGDEVVALHGLKRAL